MLRDTIKSMGKSLAQIVASLPEDEREAVLEGMDEAKLLYDWSFWARPEQQEPDEDWWTIWAIVAGRGVGKTRSGSEWVKDKAQTPNTRIALVARTSADGRDVMVEGESGIMNIYPPSEQPTYSPANRRITWPNGSIATTFSADVPDQVRGPQFHYAWCDEMAAWNHVPGVDGATAWDNVQIATRLGDRPKLLATTTPKRLPAMQELLKREGKDVIVTRGSTLDNAGNLGEAYLNFVYGLYAGTRMEQQELHGIMLDDVEGALWDEPLITRSRVTAPPIGLPLKVIAVDPSVAEEPKDECGIIVAGATGGKTVSGRHAYILDDASVHGSPDVWAKEVVRLWEVWRCPVVVEVNQGGALVKRMIHSLNPDIKVIEVRARQGKAVRAEPVLLKYDQGRIHHVGWLGTLESQMCSWVPGETKKSPDRLDALVYAVIALIVDPPPSLGAGPMRAKSPARHQLPTAGRGHSWNRRRR
jgi:phage terminase large subunit-like protein